MDDEKSTSSWVEKIPESTRRRIFILSMVVISMVVVISWLVTLQFSIPGTLNNSDQNATQDSKEIINGLVSTVSSTTGSFTDLKKQLEKIGAGPVTSNTLTPEQMTALRQQIITDHAATWLTFHDTSTDFLIMYPPEIGIQLASTSTDPHLLVGFRRQNEVQNFIEIKKYNTASEFEQLPNIIGSEQKNNYVIVSFGDQKTLVNDATATMILLTAN